MKLEKPLISHFQLKPIVTKASAELINKIKVARASSDYLKTLLPEIENEDDSPDIMAVSFDAAVANLVNLNDDGVLTPTAKLLTPSFINKPINIEHIKSWVVGSILTYGYSKFPNGDMLENAPEDGDLTPFNMCLGGVLWKHVDPYFCEMVEESSDKFSYNYQGVSASWEVGFDEFVIALGSKNLKDAEIVTDDAKVKELSQYLKNNGGNGFMDDGTPVYCVISGKPVGLGIGLTGSPAGNVKGITTSNKQQKEMQTQCGASVSVTVNKKIEETPKIISQSQNLNVKKNTMKINDIADINEDFLKEANASNEIRNFIKDQLKKVTEDLTAKANEEKTKAEDVKKEAEANKAKAAELEQEVLKVKNELQEIKTANEAKAKEESNAKHLSEVKAEFTLDAKAEEIVKAQIKDLDDAQFTQWKTNFATLCPSLKKEVEDPATKIVVKAKVKDAEVPNALGGEESLKDKAKRLFGQAKKND